MDNHINDKNNIPNLLEDFPPIPVKGDMVLRRSVVYQFDGRDWNVYTVLPDSENDTGNTKVLDFINKFKSSGVTTITNLFTVDGFGYWFAVILAKRFNGKIMVNTVNNYFACKIGQFLYDITGVITRNIDYYKDWDNEKRDTFATANIIKDCILHIDGFINYEANTCNGESLYNY